MTDVDASSTATGRPLASLVEWVSSDRPSSSRRVFVAVLGILFVVYAATTNWTSATTDPLTNDLSGWYLGNTGSVVMTEHENLYDYRGTAAWVIESPRGAVSHYPPGASLFTGAAYALTPGDLERRDLYISRYGETIDVLLPPFWPGALMAVLVTATAMAALAVVFHELGTSPLQAVAGGVAAGLATGSWSIASNMPWTHGPAMLCIALAVLAASRDRWWWAGLALGVGVTIRPHIAVIALILGVGITLTRRRIVPVVAVGIGSSMGLAALLAYNAWLWAGVTVAGGYGGGFTENLASPDAWYYVRNIAVGLFSPVTGVVPWAPFLVVLGAGAWVARRHLPDWSIAMSIGAVAYLLIQWKANRASGGQDFFAYRYPLEPMVAMAPLLFLGWKEWVHGDSTRERVLRLTLGIGVLGQAVGAVLS